MCKQVFILLNIITNYSSGTISPPLHLDFQTRRWSARIFLLRWNWILHSFSCCVRFPVGGGSDGPSSHIPLCGMWQPRPILGGASSLSISSSIMLCNTQHAIKTSWHTWILRCLNPRSKTPHLAFNIPNTHSISFRMLSMFAENADSRGEFVCDLINGQIAMGHCRYPLSQIR